MFDNDILLGELPDVLSFNDGTKVKTAEDWERRKAEFYDMVIDTEYGGMPPQPEVFKVDKVCMGFNREFDTYRITTGTKEKQITFSMHILFPKKSKGEDVLEKFPVILTGDGCFRDCTTDVQDECYRRGYAIAIFDRTELAPDMYNTDRTLGLYSIYPDLPFLCDLRMGVGISPLC